MEHFSELGCPKHSPVTMVVEHTILPVYQFIVHWFQSTPGPIC